MELPPQEKKIDALVDWVKDRKFCAKGIGVIAALQTKNGTLNRSL